MEPRPRSPFDAGTQASAAGTPHVAPPAAERAGAAPRWPVHVIVALGLGTGVYAFSLASVVALQANTDRELAADREPVRQAIDLLGTNHEAFAASLDAARLRYTAATDGYGALVDGIDALHARLDRLGAAIQEIEGIDVRAPSIAARSGSTKSGASSKATSGSSSSKTTTSGSTGSSSGKTSGSGTTVVAPPPPPPPAPPATQATTGASGAPP